MPGSVSRRCVKVSSTFPRHGAAGGRTMLGALDDEIESNRAASLGAAAGRLRHAIVELRSIGIASTTGSTSTARDVGLESASARASPLHRATFRCRGRSRIDPWRRRSSTWSWPTPASTSRELNQSTNRSVVRRAEIRGSCSAASTRVHRDCASDEIDGSGVGWLASPAITSGRLARRA